MAGRSRATAALLGLGAVVIVAALVLAAAWRLEGGRWYVVATPSMGSELPVGTLLLTLPTTVDQTQVGDVVSFRSPGSGAVYTHRVTEVTTAGLTTRGDVNGAPDAWTLTDDDLIGSVVWRVEGLGWLLRALPLLLLGVGLVWLLTSRLQPSRRGSLRLVGVSACAAGVGAVLRPWVGVERLSQSAPTNGSPGVVLEVVSTGLLPIRVQEADGRSTVGLGNGDVGELHLTRGATTGAYDVLARLDLSGWWWIGLVALCLAPLLWCLVVGLPALPADDPDQAQDGGEGQDGLPAGTDDAPVAVAER